jgi:hypothetical protein
MAQNEMHQDNPAPPPGRTWRIEFGRLNLSHPTVWQTALLLILGFTIGAGFGLIFS